MKTLCTPSEPYSPSSARGRDRGTHYSFAIVVQDILPPQNRKGPSAKTTSFYLFSGHRPTFLRRRLLPQSVCRSSATRAATTVSRAALSYNPFRRSMSPSSYHTTSTISPVHHRPASNDTSLSAILAASSSSHHNTAHSNGNAHTNSQSMDARQQDYAQSGLHSPYTVYTDHSSEGVPAEHASATAQYQQSVKFDPDVSRSASHVRPSRRDRH